ncbi:MAG TPA: NAD-dependent epimerase/dehydratase family protein [Thermoplasmataceae archaeon]|nr:NAD-dependent epimerase/dehydratase family protein [Thermoplasmataceae archaeon]
MRKILITGACGQIGSELVPYLAKKYGKSNVISSDVSAGCENGSDFEFLDLDVTDFEAIENAIDEHDVDTVYHLAAILSATGEKKPFKAFDVNLVGTNNILRAGIEKGLSRVVIPSTIGVFGPETPRENVPVVTVTRPRTMYGITKVTTEMLGEYYFEKFDLDVRGLRFPGIMSYVREPTAGTTDYSVQMFYHAVRGEPYKCFLRADAYLPMMYMPDAVSSLVKLAEADLKNLTRHTDYNVASYSFSPEELYNEIRKEVPGLEVSYEPDYRQEIAETWPASLDTTLAERDWGFGPEYDLERTVKDMIQNLKVKLA